MLSSAFYQMFVCYAAVNILCLRCVIRYHYGQYIIYAHRVNEYWVWCVHCFYSLVGMSVCAWMHTHYALRFLDIQLLFCSTMSLLSPMDGRKHTTGRGLDKTGEWINNRIDKNKKIISLIRMRGHPSPIRSHLFSGVAHDEAVTNGSTF